MIVGVPANRWDWESSDDVELPGDVNWLEEGDDVAQPMPMPPAAPHRPPLPGCPDIVVLLEDEEWLRARGVAKVPLNLLVVVCDQELSADTKALTHILINDQTYQKGYVSHKIVTSLLGNGLLAVETTEHKRQVGLSTDPDNAFTDQYAEEDSAESPQQLCSAYVLTSLQNSAFGVPQIRGLTAIFNQKSVQVRDIWNREIGDSGSSRINIFGWLRKMTLDVIGEAANTGGQGSRSSARELLADSQADIKAGGVSAIKRDLLSLLVQSNMSHEIQEDQRLSDIDVVAQIPTFFVAGHETSGGTPQHFNRRPIDGRTELLPVSGERRSGSHACIPPVAFSRREAMEDEVLPLSKRYLDRNGRSYDTISVPKGTLIQIPISAVHRDPEIWGADADVFSSQRPESACGGASSQGRVIFGRAFFESLGHLRVYGSGQDFLGTYGAIVASILE
ncbi:cytochrome P450 [Mycena leptocephala]|nr:cytochrome P450 [Mycena leptocephala]